MVEVAVGLKSIKIGGKLVEKLGGPPASAAGDAMASFISSYLGRNSGEPNADFILNPYLCSGQTISGELNPALRSLGILFITIEEGGAIYRYRIRVSVTRSMTILFTCGQPDTYSLNCQRTGTHHIDYNSPRPEIHQVVIRYS